MLDSPLRLLGTGTPVVVPYGVVSRLYLWSGEAGGYWYATAGRTARALQGTAMWHRGTGSAVFVNSCLSTSHCSPVGAACSTARHAEHTLKLLFKPQISLREVKDFVAAGDTEHIYRVKGLYHQ